MKTPNNAHKLSVGRMLLFTAAVFQATQMARAFHLIDSSSVWAEIGGVTAGVVINVSLAYAASRLPRLRGKHEKRLASIAFWLLILLTPLFMAPINYVTMGALWNDAPKLKWLLAGLSASLVDVAIVLVAFADGSLLPAESQQNSQTTTQTAKSTAQTTKPASKETQTAKVYVCEWTNCGAEFAKPQSYSAHVSQHRRKETKMLEQIKSEKVSL